MNLGSGNRLDVLVSSVLLASLLGPGARADTVLTRFATFMHAGPAKAFAVTDEIPTKTEVDLAGCANEWCQVRYGAAYGWVEQKMLAATTSATRLPAGARPADCFDFVRAGWPDAGDLEALCIYAPTGEPPSPAPNKPGG